MAVETDETFIVTLILNATSVASGGATAEHVRTDLRFLLQAITTSARSQLFLLMTSTIAKALAVMHDTSGGPAFPGMNYNGGTIGGIQCVVTDGMPASTAVLVDAQQVAAASETIQLSATNEAAVQMDSAPDIADQCQHGDGFAVAEQHDGPQGRAIFRRREAHDHRRRGLDRRQLHRRQPGSVIMNAPTLEQIAAAERLGVSLHFTNSPLTIARLIEMVEELQQRVAALEDKRGLRK